MLHRTTARARGRHPQCGVLLHAARPLLRAVLGRPHYPGSALLGLAQRLGLDLLRHDGGCAEALSRLPERVTPADAVLCSTDRECHSYSLFKRRRKLCLLFKGACFSNVAVALMQVVVGRVTAALPPYATCWLRLQGPCKF